MKRILVGAMILIMTAGLVGCEEKELVPGGVIVTEPPVVTSAPVATKTPVAEATATPEATATVEPEVTASPEATATASVKIPIEELSFQDMKTSTADVELPGEGYAEGQLCYVLELDMNYDGTPEKVVAVYRDEPMFYDFDYFNGDVWLVSGSGKAEILFMYTDIAYNGLTYVCINEEYHIMVDVQSAAINSDSVVFTYRNGGLYRFDIPEGAKSYYDNGDMSVIVESYTMTCEIVNGNEMWLGHVWMPYRYHFVNGGYRPYAIEKISLEKVKAIAAFDGVKAEYGEAYEYIYREDGVLIVNVAKKEDSATTYYKAVFYELKADKSKFVETYVCDGIY